MTKTGSFMLVLHAHLPYVISHGRWPHGMDWLNEAAAETYIPLLNVFNRLISEGVKLKVVVGITPVLMEQLSDSQFKIEFKEYLRVKIDAALKDEKQFLSFGNKDRARMARFWNDYYTGIRDNFTQRYDENIVAAFGKLQDKGAVEIITCAATHGYLPLIGYEEAVNAQIKQGVAVYERQLKRKPRGIWLPECAYRPRYRWSYPVENAGEPFLRRGVEEFLYENGIDYFIVDHHLLEGGKAIGAYLDRFKGLKEVWGRFEKEFEHVWKVADKKRSPYNVYLVSSNEGKSPTAIFTRDHKTGLQVWSGEWGYPGDINYLEFHKKHFPGGLRYWKITSAKSDLGTKEEYDPGAVEERIKENAGHFKEVVKGVLEEHKKSSGKPGIVVSPFDAELFGHWWFEGPRWLYYVLKWMDADPELELVTGGEYLDKNKPSEVISIPEGSWGEGGFHWIWFNNWTKWTWKRIYEAEKIMKDQVGKYVNSPEGDVKRFLKQMGKELLLMESSDWQFLISTWSAKDYAELRMSNHYNDFMRIYGMLKKKTGGEELTIGDWEFLGDCEKRDCLFSDLDIQWWLPKEEVN